MVGKNLNTQQVPSFKIFIRDNRSKMKAYYPFLSQEQIMLKLRQQWKQLDDSKRQSYSKLVIAKNCKTGKLTRHRSPSTQKLDMNTFSKSDHFMNYGRDYRPTRKDSHFTKSYKKYEFDNHSFMENTVVINNLNPELNYAHIGQSTTGKLHGQGKTYAGRVFQLQHRNPTVFSEIVGSNKSGILKCKDKRKIQGRVSFSGLEATFNNDRFKFDDDDIDEEVLYVEKTTNNEDFTAKSVNKNTVFEEMLYRPTVQSQNLKDNDNEQVQIREKSLPVKNNKKCESKKRKINIQQKEAVALKSSENTHTRFSKRLKKLAPDNIPKATLCNRSISKRASCKKLKHPVIANVPEIFSNKSKTCSVEKKRELFQVVSDLSTTQTSSVLSNKIKYQQFKLNEEMIKQTQDTVFSSGRDIAPDKSLCLNLEHKIGDKHQAESKINKSNQSQEHVTQQAQSKAGEYMTRCAKNSRMTLLCSNKFLPQDGCSGSTKQWDDYPVQEDPLRDTIKKSSEKADLEFYGKQGDIYWKYASNEINNEDSESGSEFDAVAYLNCSEYIGKEDTTTDHTHLNKILKNAATSDTIHKKDSANREIDKYSKILTKFNDTSLESTDNCHFVHRPTQENITIHKEDCVNNEIIDEYKECVAEFNETSNDSTDSCHFVNTNGNNTIYRKNPTSSSNASNLCTIKKMTDPTVVSSKNNTYKIITEDSKGSHKDKKPNSFNSAFEQHLPELSVDSEVSENDSNPCDSHIKPFQHLHDPYKNKITPVIVPKLSADWDNFELYRSKHGKNSNILKCQRNLRFTERISSNKSPLHRKCCSGDSSLKIGRNRQTNNSPLKNGRKNHTNNYSEDSYSESDTHTEDSENISESDKLTEDSENVSEPDKLIEDSENVFVSNMADQTTSALLQAIERMKNLTSPQNLTEKCVFDDVHSPDISEKGDSGCLSMEQKSLSGMFQNAQNSTKKTMFTPAKQRILSSATVKTPSNFTKTMFDDQDIFL